MIPHFKSHLSLAPLWLRTRTFNSSAERAKPTPILLNPWPTLLLNMYILSVGLCWRASHAQKQT